MVLFQLWKLFQWMFLSFETHRFVPSTRHHLDLHLMPLPSGCFIHPSFLLIVFSAEYFQWHTVLMVLTHWGRVTHICVGKLTNIGSDNGLAPSRRQAIIWTNAGILLIRPLGTNFSEFLIIIHTFSFNKMHLKMSSAKWRPFCLGLNVLTHCGLVTQYGVNKLVQVQQMACSLFGAKPLPAPMPPYGQLDPW